MVRDFFTGRMPFNSPNQQCSSTEGLTTKYELPVFKYYAVYSSFLWKLPFKKSCISHIVFINQFSVFLDVLKMGNGIKIVLRVEQNKSKFVDNVVSKVSK